MNLDYIKKCTVSGVHIETSIEHIPVWSKKFWQDGNWKNWFWQ